MILFVTFCCDIIYSTYKCSKEKSILVNAHVSVESQYITESEKSLAASWCANQTWDIMLSVQLVNEKHLLTAGWNCLPLIAFVFVLSSNEFPREHSILRVFDVFSMNFSSVTTENKSKVLSYMLKYTIYIDLIQVFRQRLLSLIIITSFFGHFTYLETLRKVVKWSMKWPFSIQCDPIEMFCSRYTLFLWLYMVSCGALLT